MDKPLYKSKTLWTGVSGIITAAGAYFTGAMDVGTAVQTVTGCLLGIFLRSGMNSSAQ